MKKQSQKNKNAKYYFLDFPETKAIRIRLYIKNVRGKIQN